MCCAVPSCCSSSYYCACFSSLPDGEGGFRTRYPREEYWSNPFGPVWPWRRLWLDSHTEGAHQSVHGRCLKFDCPSLIKPFNFCILDHFKGCCCLNPQHLFFFLLFFHRTNRTPKHKTQKEERHGRRRGWRCFRHGCPSSYPQPHRVSVLGWHATFPSCHQPHWYPTDVVDFHIDGHCQLFMF